jgi:hypothetical protein
MASTSAEGGLKRGRDIAKSYGTYHEDDDPQLDVESDPEPVQPALRDHPLLEFQPRTRAYTRLQHLIHRPLLQTRTIDWILWRR